MFIGSLHRVLAPALALLVAVTTACSGSRTATPMPEPPALDPNLIDVPLVGIDILSDPRPVNIAGSASSVTSGSAASGVSVRITNLETTLDTVTSAVAGDGSFSIQVLVSDGDELRLEAVADGQRSAPFDFTVEGDPRLLLPSPRHDCVEFDPGLVLGFDASAIRTLTVVNRCSSAIQLSNPSLRLASAEYQLETGLPVTVEASETVALTISRADAASAVDQVLFLGVEFEAVVIRYPVTLFPLP